MAYAGTFNVCLRNRSVFGINLERNQSAIRWQGARQPDGAVASQRAYFKNPASLLHTGKDVKQLPLSRCDVDRRQPCLSTVEQRGIEGIIGFYENVGDVIVNGCPYRISHSSVSSVSSSSQRIRAYC